MFEINLQIRKYLAQDAVDRSALADKISLWGCYEYLEKLKPGREHPAIARGYEWMQRKIAGYEANLRDEVLRERRARQRQWFGKSYSQLAKEVSRGSENLSAAYHLLSADAHGTWVLATEVASPEPGHLDFRGYPDKATMYRWAAEVLDYATHLYLESWNEAAGRMDSPLPWGIGERPIAWAGVRRGSHRRPSPILAPRGARKEVLLKPVLKPGMWQNLGRRSCGSCPGRGGIIQGSKIGQRTRGKILGRAAQCHG
jgi:hypothetical protein